MSNARQLAANLPREGGLSNRNLLINGDLSIWQRGTSATYSTNTGRGYVADRWYAEGYPLNMTIAKSTIDYDGITYSSAALTGMSGNWSFLQAIENGYTYNKGKTLTFSFVASGSGTIQPITWIGSVNTQFFGGAITLTSTPTRYEITHTITSSGTGAELYIGFNATGGTMNVSLLQLERGDTATPFEHRSYSEELQACQRFFHNYKGNYYKRFPMNGTSTTGALWFNKHPAPMRATPSITTYNISGSTINLYDYTNGTIPNFSSFQLAESDIYETQVQVIHGGGTSAGSFASWRWTGTPDAWVGFDAEL